MAPSVMKRRPRNARRVEPWMGELLRVFYDELAWRHGQSRRIERAEGTAALLDWSRRYLPHYFTRPPSLMHRWLAAELDRMWRNRGGKLNVLGPRGGAKSTIGTLACPLMAAVNGWEPFIWILSDTKQQAYAHLENLKSELIDNPRLAAD